MSDKLNKMPKMTVAEYLTRQIDTITKSGEKTQKDIADELGYTKPNIITMFKQGKTNLPLNKVGPMAKALGVDSVYLLRMVLNEYYPETYTAIEHLLKGGIVTKNEEHIVMRLRELTHHADPQLIDDKQNRALENFADALLSNQPK